MNTYSSGWEDYALIDSGDRMRLEQVGRFLVVRPEPNALWSRQELDQWEHPNLRYLGEKDNPWIINDPKAAQGFTIRWEDLHLIVKPTPFRHLGFFPEQEGEWQWLRQLIHQTKSTPKVLNLFAYTGLASIVAAHAGAEVTHVDASKGANYWAADNAQASGLKSDSIRWIVDDVRKFLSREIKRGKKYDLILADPPVFGRGPQGTIWRLEDDLAGLIRQIRELYSDKPLGFSLNFYATSLYPSSVQRSVEDNLKWSKGPIQLEEVGLQEKNSERKLQTGFWLHS